MRSSLAVVLVAAMALPGCLTSVFGGVTPSDYLSSDPYSKWVIEVDYATGKAPSSALLDFVRGRLNEVANKPDGIEFRLNEALSDTGRTWNLDNGELVRYAASHQDLKTEGNTVVTHLLFVRGGTNKDNGDSKVLGVAFGRNPVVIFSDAIDGLCEGVLIGCAIPRFYESVVTHEFGHAMGLVDNGIPMVRPHEASSCGNQADDGHSSNQNSVMFCGVENSSDILGLFGNVPPSSFDNDDRADLRAAGGK